MKNKARVRISLQVFHTELQEHFCCLDLQVFPICNMFLFILHFSMHFLQLVARIGSVTVRGWATAARVSLSATVDKEAFMETAHVNVQLNFVLIILTNTTECSTSFHHCTKMSEL